MCSQTLTGLDARHANCAFEARHAIRLARELGLLDPNLGLYLTWGVADTEHWKQLRLHTLKLAKLCGEDMVGWDAAEIEEEVQRNKMLVGR
jgi:hypothetical protein